MRGGRPAERRFTVGRQRQIRGSVTSRGARVLEVRIHLPPPDSLVSRRNSPSTLKSGGFPRVLGGGAADVVGRDEQNAASTRQCAVISLAAIPVPQRQ